MRRWRGMSQMVYASAAQRSLDILRVEAEIERRFGNYCHQISRRHRCTFRLEAGAAVSRKLPKRGASEHDGTGHRAGTSVDCTMPTDWEVPCVAIAESEHRRVGKGR